MNPISAHSRTWSLAPGVWSLFLFCAACGSPAPPPNPAIKPAAITGPDWTIKRRYTAHYALVVDVECANRDKAVEIARTLVEPIKSTLEEALIFVRPPKSTGAKDTRRVQWLRKTDSYSVMDY